MNISINEIKSIIKEIENNNKLLQMLLLDQNAMDTIMVKQFQRKKRLLYKELAAKLIQSNLDIRHYEKLYLNIVVFLKQDEQQTELSSDMDESFSKAEQMLMI